MQKRDLDIRMLETGPAKCRRAAFQGQCLHSDRKPGGILFREYCFGGENSLSLTEFWGKLGEFWGKLGEFASVHK